MDYDLLYNLYTNQQVTDIELILDDGFDKIILKVHKLVLMLHSPFFLKLFTFGQNFHSVDIKVPNAYVAQDLIMSFYGQKTISCKYAKWRYELAMAKCKDYFGVKNSPIEVPEEIDEDSYDYFLELCGIVGFDDDCFKLLTTYLPVNYDTGKLSKELAQKMVETDIIHIIPTVETDCVNLWNIFTGELVCGYKHTDVVDILQMCNNKFIVTMSPLECIIWLKTTNEIYYRDLNVVKIDFFSDNVHCVMAYKNNSIRKFNLLTKTFVLDFDKEHSHETEVNILKVASSRKYLVSASVDSMVKIWDASNGDYLYGFEASTNSISHLNFTIEFTLIEILNAHNTLKIWKIDKCKTTQSILKIDPLEVIATSRKSDISEEIYIAVKFEQGINIIDTKTNTIVRFFDEESSRILFSPDSKFIAIYVVSYIKLYNINTGHLLYSFHESTSVFTPDSKYFIVTFSSRLRIFNLRTNVCHHHDIELKSYTIGFTTVEDIIIYHTKTTQRDSVVLYNMRTDTIINILELNALYKNSNKSYGKNALRLLEIIE